MSNLYIVFFEDKKDKVFQFLKKLKEFVNHFDGLVGKMTQFSIMQENGTNFGRAM